MLSNAKQDQAFAHDSTWLLVLIDIPIYSIDITLIVNLVYTL